MKYLIGIDIGTSGTKTVLFDMTTPVCEASASYPMYQQYTGWAEQNPEDWWQASIITIRKTLITAGITGGDIAGIGLTGQMHGLVMLDGEGNPLRKSIIWCDGRTTDECRILEETVGRKRLTEITANPAMLGFTASKILWVRTHEPQIFARCKHILLPKDYVRYRLTGEFITDVSDASGMQLLDVKHRVWSQELFQKLGLKPSLFSDVVESSDRGGCISECAAQSTGLSKGTPVAGGAGDQAAAGVGNGIICEGRICANIGTSGVVFAHTDTPLCDPSGRVQTFCHAVKNCWHIMGVTQGAGLSMKWLKDNFYPTQSGQTGSGYDEINLQIATVPAGSEGLIYLPYLMGERTPHLDPDARGVFFGLSPQHEKSHFARAVMEGVSYSLCDCLDVLREFRLSVEEVRVSGGGANSRVWQQILSDVFGVPTAVTDSPQAGAWGAAILAGVAAGEFSDVAEGCRSIKIKDGLAPLPQNREIYQGYLSLYRNLYVHLKDDFKKLASLVSLK